MLIADKELLFSLTTESGEMRIYADGTLEGFPAGAVNNRILPIMRRLQAENAVVS